MDPSEHGRRLFPSSPNGLDPMEKPHTLEEYAVDHFRPPPKRTASKSLTISRLVSSLFIVKKHFMLGCCPSIALETPEI